ncbi:acetamidase [Xylariomycetidae sp. FL2044]|nr:acetamidase [Xylariomycetidae sp. FL2044]
MSHPAPITTASGASWEEVARDRQRHRDATIASLVPPLPDRFPDLPLNTSSIPKSVLSREELAITSSDVEDLIPKLATGTWSATDVVKAFMRRAGLAQKLSNCITELLPVRALERAAQLDQYLGEHKKPVGVLHGLPISVKEHIGMKGCDLNAGFVSWVGRVADADALILQTLWDAGAVFYARTTQPQTLMHLETSSNIYGVTVNPYNTTLTSGGSSGGEGALVGLRGSVLGIGTDIGGSIRSPAANNGVFGFKPTSLRLPLMGWSATMDGAESIMGCIGPLSTSLEGLRIFAKTVVEAKPWLRDPSLVPLGWRNSEDWFGERKEKKLRVGVIWNDGVVRPHPPVLGALSAVVERLAKSKGVEVVDWKPWRHDLAWSIIASLYFCDGGREESEAIEASGEPWLPLSKWIIQDNPHVREHNIPSLWKAVQAREDYRKKYAEIWNATATSSATSQPVDVILCPVGPSVAPKLNTGKYWGYTAQWNLLDYPAIVFPTGESVGMQDNRDRDGYPDNYQAMSESDKYNWDLWQEYGAQGYEGAPISLQLVGRRYEDEKLFNSIKTIFKNI